jgi:sphingosine kinase
MDSVFILDSTAVASSSSALRKTLVIINPKSGRKRSQKLFSKHVQHILDTAKLPYEVKTTEYAGHAADICLELNVDEYECVATCSGDGLVHECMNGFLSRPDYQQIKDRVSFCPVPCGTSNALAASFYMVRPEDAAIALCRRESLPCDVFTFELIGDAVSSTKEGTTTTTTEEEKPTAKKEGEVVAAAKSGSVALRMDKRLAFLMVAWGFIADCDLGTENMRWMGSLRNQVGALKFIQKKKRQHARIRYQKADAADGEWTETEDDFFIVILCNLPYISFDVAFSPSSRARDGQLHLIMVRDAKRMDMLKLFTVVEKGNHLPNPSVECVPVKTAEVLFDPSKCDTYISLDGEPMPLQSFRVQVCPDSVMNIRGLNLYLPSAKL